MSGTQPEPAALDTKLAALECQLASAGLRGALAFLNERTRHRYTGVYLFDPPVLRTHCLFDRENPDLRSVGDLVLRETYCSIVADHNEGFQTDDARKDARLEGHPARQGTLAYHGFPLCDETGYCFGSLCHWDVRPRLMPTLEIPLLQAAAPVLARRILEEIRHLNG